MHQSIFAFTQLIYIDPRHQKIDWSNFQHLPNRSLSFSKSKPLFRRISLCSPLDFKLSSSNDINILSLFCLRLTWFAKICWHLQQHCKWELRGPNIRKPCSLSTTTGLCTLVNILFEGTHTHTRKHSVSKFSRQEMRKMSFPKRNVGYQGSFSIL